MTFPRRRLNSKGRADLYEREAEKARHAGLGEHPRCNIPFCGQPVRPGERWAESHYPKPHAWNGRITGVAHFRCNFDYWCQVEAPMMAKAERVRRRFIGAQVSATPLPGGRDDRLKRTMRGKTVLRESGEPWRAGR